MDVLAAFDGLAPLFPLPGATLFPHVVQPFHMFEPRYRALADHVLSGNRLMAVGILKPGFSDQYETKHAPIFDAVCLGYVSDGERLDDGRFNLIVGGVSRARVIDEPESDNPFRMANLELVRDLDDQSSQLVMHATRGELLERFRHACPELVAHPVVSKTVDSEIPLGSLTDFIAHVHGLDSELGAEILAEPNALHRARRLCLHLSSTSLSVHVEDKFPPGFSAN